MHNSDIYFFTTTEKSIPVVRIFIFFGTSCQYLSLWSLCAWEKCCISRPWATWVARPCPPRGRTLWRTAWLGPVQRAGDRTGSRTLSGSPPPGTTAAPRPDTRALHYFILWLTITSKVSKSLSRIGEGVLFLLFSSVAGAGPFLIFRLRLQANFKTGSWLRLLKSRVIFE